MKFGQAFERESVPQWSLHNLDYNSLKHEIKVHTTRDQATAIAIPGHVDTALARFEDSLYMELGLQHERLHLFVTSKADEISRRLEHLSKSIHRWTSKRRHETNPADSLRDQRRCAKYDRELLQCGGEIQALSRFVGAQVVAFRKIMKKYKKWTGSTTLGARFTDNILSDPKSFTRRAFVALQERYDEITRALHSIAPLFSEPSSPESLPNSFGNQLSHSLSSQTSPNCHRFASPGAQRASETTLLPSPQMTPQRVKYWNEYDNGSECGGQDEEEYAIYIDPEESTSFPGLEYVQGIFKVPIEKCKGWLKLDKSPERQSLLRASRHPQQYSSTNFISESDDEAGYASSDGFPVTGYVTHYALPSIGQQQANRYREMVLSWGVAASFVASFVLLAVAGTLILTGKHKLRVEVDAGVTVGVVASLFASCSGLAMSMYRQDSLSVAYLMMVWGTFIATCILNGMLLVLVVGNPP